MHIFKIQHVISSKARGCSLGRYDDGLQKVANGFADQNGMKKFWSC